MPEHYTKNTVSAAAWCLKCGRDTEHRVDGGHRGPCLVCLAKPTAKVEARPVETQTEMFGGK